MSSADQDDAANRAAKAIDRAVAAMTAAPQRVRWVAHKLQLITGLLLLVMGFVAGQHRLHLLWAGAATTGRIVDFRQVHWTSQSAQGQTTHSPFMPVVEFEHAGARHRFQDTFGSSSAAGLNSPVDVIFDPQQPQRAMLDRGFKNWLPWGPLLLVGAFLLGVALVRWRQHRW